MSKSDTATRDAEKLGDPTVSTHANPQIMKWYFYLIKYKLSNILGKLLGNWARTVPVIACLNCRIDFPLTIIWSQYNNEHWEYQCPNCGVYWGDR